MTHPFRLIAILLSCLSGCASLQPNDLCIQRDSLNVWLEQDLVIEAEDCAGNTHQWSVPHPDQTPVNDI